MTREIIRQIERDYWAEKADPIDMSEIFDLAQKALEQEPKPMVEIDLYSVIKQKYIEREVLDKISAEIEELFSYVEFDEDTKTSYNMVRLEEVQRVIDKYKGEGV
jgi:hypothetical protein